LNPDEPEKDGEAEQPRDPAETTPQAPPVDAGVEASAQQAPEPPLTLDTPAPPPPLPPYPPRRDPATPPPRVPPARPVRRGGGFGRFLRRAFVALFLLVVVFPLAGTLLFRFVPPPFTILMVQRVFEGKGWDYRWRSIDKMSPALVQAAIAAEDARFCSHKGFDLEAIEKAMANNRRGKRIRGGSTISQQTAKNVFLWPARSWVRKGLEAYYTVLIETVWGKRRIMEVYLNVAEMGAGTYGAEAAARRYFGVSADQLTRAQAARLVAILPNPLKYKAVQSGPYVAKRSRRIGAAAGTVRNDGLASCVGKLRKPTAAERAEPETPRKPIPRREAPAKKSDPLPPPATEPAPALIEEPAPLPVPEAPPAEPVPGSD
jgi:monofunctional biosynthetic peptidoglycan transglycosylase